MNLCTKCNNKKGYYSLNINGVSKDTRNIDCYNEETKPENFYLDSKNNEYKICHSNCKTCDYGGDGNQNNCTSCKNNQILKPDIPNSSNCVKQCDFFYYYQGEQYKCTPNEVCPDDYQLEIKEKRKCIDKCENDNEYIIKYDGECYKEPPEGTNYDEISKKCLDINTNICKLNEKILRLISNENITEKEIAQKAELYAKEFDYTNKHVTVYKNDFYSITLYMNGQCLSDLNLNIDEIDFGECYTKVKEDQNISGNLIIVIISKIINNISYTIDKFIFNPEGEKINYLEICQNETVTVKRDLKEQMKNSENINSLEKLTDQDIDIFDPNSAFYTDLCFHFKSPIDGKDIPVKDRLKLFYPNITLCAQGCFIKGVNLTTWKAICECALNDFVNSNILGNNVLIQKSLGEWQDILTKTNVEVMKCYKDISDIKMYKKNAGFFIVIVLIILKIFWIFIYYYNYRIKIKKYLLNLTDKYVSLLEMKKNKNLIDSSMKPIDTIKCEPPKSVFHLDNNPGNKNIGNKLKNKSRTNISGKKLTNPNIKNINILSGHNSNDNINKSDEILKEKNNEISQKDISIENNININIEEYIKTDPDDMDYDDAIRRDKRTYCQYFWSKIITEQIILSTFFKSEILRPLPMKMILLILNIDLYLIINGLFFNEDYISDLLKSEADTISSFIARILDRIVIITITGVIINYIIEFFFVEERKIKKVYKIEKNNIIILKYEIVQIIKNTFKKYNIFIIISGIIMIISLYYVFCFNNVYSSIKGEWIKSSIIIIIIMQILPMLLCFLDTSIRFISFRCKSERLFRLSSILL